MNLPKLQNLPLWQRKIILAYPELYLWDEPKSAAGGRRVICSLRCGFEFQEGWSSLVEEYSQTVAAFLQRLRTSGLQKDVCLKAGVYREKYGELTLTQGHDNLVEPYQSLLSGYTASIEARSLTICEISGEIGSPRQIGGWWRVMSEREFVKAVERRQAVCDSATDW